MERDERVYLNDILDSAKKIEEYVEGLAYDEFELDEKTIDAVIRKFEIIGEASRNISKTIREKYPLVPWGDMIAMRNILAHEYYRVGLEVVWDTIKDDLPKIKYYLEIILHDIKDKEQECK